MTINTIDKAEKKAKPESTGNRNATRDTRKTMNAQQKNLEVRVGLFFMIAVFMLTSGWSWLKSFSLFHPPQKFIVEFSDIAGLNNNAPVNINGVRVGAVEKIELIPQGKDAPTARVRCYLKINTEAVTIPKGSTITIQTQGMVGAKYIEITLPELGKGEAIPPALANQEIIQGQDPVRIELVMNKIATKLNGIVNSVGSEEVGVSLADALKHSGEAVSAFNNAAKKLDKNMDRIEKATENFTETSQKVGDAAAVAKGTMQNASGFFKRGQGGLDDVHVLAKGGSSTLSKVNRILDNPALSSDLKSTAQLAKQTADSIGQAIHELNGTLKDQPMRQDMITMLTKLNNSVEHIQTSIQTIDKLAQNQELRGDVKQMVSDAHDAVSKIDNVVSQPNFKDDLTGTMKKVRECAGDVDTAATQLHQILEKRNPLLHLIFGQPGKLKTPPSESQLAAPEHPSTTH
jgi:phospholipid/cholesterol/gamma-HCH transport system substrate-binding protein